jgi:glycosyltransferase involved in cell wall biosynthesis
MSTTLSVVMPVYNESSHVSATVDALVDAASHSGLVTDLVLVDDGSTDGSADAVRGSLGQRLPLRVLAQANRGRFEARRAGLEAATGEWILLLDARVRLRPESLRFVEQRLEAGESVWNGHVRVETDGNPYGAFSNVLVELAWREYFRDPRTTRFDAESFDRFPKGTTCFLVPRQLMLDALERFRTAYADPRHANDDTPLIRWIASQVPIHISPAFACDYTPRATLGSFLRHSVHRGVVFLDGHGRTESRYFPAVVLFFPASAGLLAASARRPALVPALGVVTAGAAFALAACTRRTLFEAVSFGALAPLYAVAHGMGMWRGLGMIARRRFAGSKT